MKKINSDFSDFTHFTEDKIFEEYQRQCISNQGDVLNVLYSGSKSPIDESAKMRFRKEKIRRIITNTYPDAPKDTLFDIFTDLLMLARFESYNSLGLALKYTDEVNRNKRLSVERRVGAAVLTSLAPYNNSRIKTIKDTKTACEEIDKVQKEAIISSKKKIHLANMERNVTDFYFTRCLEDRYIGDHLLQEIKNEARFINRINSKIFSSMFEGNFDLKNTYEDIKKSGIRDYNEKIQEITLKADNILVNFVRAHRDIFVQYFKTHNSLKDEPEWFIKEFLNSKSTYEEVFRGPASDLRSSFNYDFHFFCLQLTEIMMSDRYLNKISQEKSFTKTLKK